MLSQVYILIIYYIYAIRWGYLYLSILAFEKGVSPKTKMNILQTHINKHTKTQPHTQKDTHAQKILVEGLLIFFSCQGIIL